MRPSQRLISPDGFPLPTNPSHKYPFAPINCGAVTEASFRALSRNDRGTESDRIFDGALYRDEIG